MNVIRFFALLFLLGTLMVAGLVLRIQFASIGPKPSGSRPAHMPALTKIQVPPEELHELVAALVRAESWWNSLAFARIEYQVKVTKSEEQHERDIQDMTASYPEFEIDETAFPMLSRVWDIDRSLAFDETQVIWSGHSNASGIHTERWDGTSLIGYVDYGTRQKPNFYLKGKLSDLQSSSAWLPRIGTSAIWFADETLSGCSTWQQEPPVVAGGIQLADRSCVVLRDSRNHWIVGRTDRRVYGRFSLREWEEFYQHREVAPGVFWPMVSLRKRFGNEGLEWTDRVTVKALDVDERPDGSIFELEVEAGVAVCDYRAGYPVVFTIDPHRTPEQLAEIYSAAKQGADRLNAADRHSRELIGKDAPDLGAGEWLNSKPLSLSNLRRKRTVQLGFGSVGCAPCGSMLAMFAKAQHTSAEQLILIFAASDSVDAVQKKLDQYDLHCPAFVPADTGFGQVFERYRINGYPTLVKIDLNGKVTSHQVGMLAAED